MMLFALFCLFDYFEETWDENLNILNISIATDIFEFPEEEPGKTGTHIDNIALKVNNTHDLWFFSLNWVDICNEN